MAESPERLYRRWEELRLRSAARSDEGRLRRAVAFTARAFRRVRDLGRAWHLQGELLRVLLEDQQALRQRLDEELPARDTRLDELEARIPGAIAELHEALLNLRDRQASLWARQLRVEAALSDVAAADAPAPLTVLAAGLDRVSFGRLLARLDESDLLAERPCAVDVSVQDAAGEELIAVAHARFGARLAGAGETYLHPNDLWVHVDFTPEWDRPLLLDNAAARLRAGGLFALVTAAGSGPPRRHPALAPVEDSEVVLPCGRVRLLAWRAHAP